MNETTAQASTVIDAPRSKVWRALTEPDLIREYFMGATVTTDWNVGSPITFVGEWNGNAYHDKGEVMAVDAEVELRFSHWSPLSGEPDVPENYHVVDITLSGDDGQTTVTLTQSNLIGPATETDHANRAAYDNNWNATLEGLKTVAER